MKKLLLLLTVLCASACSDPKESDIDCWDVRIEKTVSVGGLPVGVVRFYGKLKDGSWHPGPAFFSQDVAIAYWEHNKYFLKPCTP